MNVSKERSISCWMQDAPAIEASPLQSDQRCEVVVIGSGLAGLSTAYELGRFGRSVIVIDRGEKDKTEVVVSAEERAVADAASELITAGDLTGKSFELSWLYRPRGLKAERLLLIGGGKTNRFTASELRKVAGAAVRANGQRV